MELKNNKLAKDSFGASWEYASAFKAWLNEVKGEQFDYVAAVTRRGPNIIELLLRDSNDLSPLAPCFTTDNGLLMQAEDIVKYYSDKGAFPTIAVLDDLLVHGRSLNQFLNTFQALLLECARQLNDALNEQKFEDDFYKCLTIWIFAINDAPFCLKQEYQWRLRYQNIWPEGKWRKLSSSIADFIWKENIANTAYILSARTTTLQQQKIQDGKNSSWILDDSVRYCGGEQEFYLLSDAYPYGIYPAVRSYVRKGYRYYTPYFFAKKLKPERVTLVLRRLFEFMEELDGETSNELICLFNRIGKHPQRLSIYCQLFYLLLSQITLRVFVSEHFTLQRSEILESDSEKIGRNFGCAKDNGLLLERLYGLSWTKEQLIELTRLLSDTKDGFDTFEECEATWKHADILRALELKIYTQALAHEENARNCDKKHTTDRNDNISRQEARTGEKEICDFLAEVREEIGLSPRDIKATVVMLSCVTQMMDRGDISLKARAEIDSIGEFVFFSAIRNTEMSLSIMPRKISDVFAEFFRVAQFYWRDDNFPQRVKVYFENKATEEKTVEDAKRDTENAIQFAELICDHRAIVDSMLNWKSVYDFAADAQE